MEYIVISIILLILIIVLKFALHINIKDIKKLKELAFDVEKKRLSDKLPENEFVAKSILKILKNDHTKVKQSDDSKETTSIYMVLTDSIIIANIKNTFTRIQTIAHECIHSVQDRTILWFNFIYTNIYNLFFISIIILRIFNIIDNIIWLFIFILMGVIYYVVRSYLECDAIIKSKWLAKEYIEDSHLLTEEEIKIMINGYDEINVIGTKMYLYRLLLKVILRTLIFSLLCQLTYGIY